jgi:hypothetical protein
VFVLFTVLFFESPPRAKTVRARRRRRARAHVGLTRAVQCPPLTGALGGTACRMQRARSRCHFCRAARRAAAAATMGATAGIWAGHPGARGAPRRRARGFNESALVRGRAAVPLWLGCRCVMMRPCMHERASLVTIRAQARMCRGRARPRRGQRRSGPSRAPSPCST